MMKLAEDSHYLRQELYELFQHDPSIFDFLQEATLDGIWYWDLVNAEHEWMSPEFWVLLGYSPHEKQHLASEWQDLIHPDDFVVAQQNLERHLANPAHPYDQIVRYTKKSGKTVWVRCRGIAIRDQFNQPIRMLGAHIDVTRLMQTTELLEIQLQRLDACKMQLSLQQQRVTQLTHEKIMLESRLQEKELEIQLLKQQAS